MPMSSSFSIINGLHPRPFGLGSLIPLPLALRQDTCRRISIRFMLQPAELLASRPGHASIMASEAFTSELSPLQVTPR